VVRLVTLEWPPYCGSALPGGGYACRVVRRAMDLAGYAVEIEFLPWNRALDVVARGEADGYFPEYPSESRTAGLLTVGFIPCAPLVFAGLRGVRQGWPGLDGLRGAVVGVVRGYRNTDEFDARQDIAKDYAETDRQNIDKLLAGRVDLILIDRAVLGRLLADFDAVERERVHVLEPALEEKTLIVSLARNNWSHRLSRDLGEAFERMAASGEMAALAAEAGIQLP